eukprot:scaffold264822_cov47-Prasinocladus_malaysianus.AAC.1
MVDMYMEARRLAQSMGSQPGRMSQDAVAEMARYHDWGSKQAPDNIAPTKPSVHRAEAAPIDCRAVWSVLEPHVRGHLSALASSGADTLPAE